MHELSIAAEIIDSLERLCAANRAARVVEAEVECGAWQQIVPESLQMAFEALRDGTSAAGATLRLRPVDMLALCGFCSEQFTPQIDDYRCPGCGRADVKIIAGREIVLRNVTLALPDGEAP